MSGQRVGPLFPRKPVRFLVQRSVQVVVVVSVAAVVKVTLLVVVEVVVLVLLVILNVGDVADDAVPVLHVAAGSGRVA